MTSRLAWGLVLGLAACGRDTKPLVLSEEAGPFPRASAPLDCRSHLAYADTGEVTRKPGPFARVDVEGAQVVLREGASETFRVPLVLLDGGALGGAGAGEKGPTGVVLAHRAIVLVGGQIVAFDRSTGRVVWTTHERVRGLLGLPGDLVLAYGEGRAVAFAAKTGKEAFVLPLPRNAQAPELVDERLVVVRAPGHVVVVDPPLATGTLMPRATGTGARRDLDEEAIGFFTARGARSDLFVATHKSILRVRRGPDDPAPALDSGAPIEAVPFDSASHIVALDAEDSVYVAAYDDRRDSAVTIRAYEVRGDELRPRFEATVPPHSTGPTSSGVGAGCAHEVALGRHAGTTEELVVASSCGPSSGVALLDAKKGTLVKRTTRP